MSRETEKFFREFQKFVEANNLKNEQDIETALAAFTAQHNSGPVEHGELDAYDYLDMAYDAKSRKKAEEYAQKALDLDPDLLDAEFLLASLRSSVDSSYQVKLEALLKKGEMQLWGKGITRDGDAGDFYTLHETRPYLRVYKAYIDLLIAEGKLRKAVDACKDILHLNECDNMGVRYTLMVLYALLEERESAEALYKEYPEEGSLMLLPYIALYYRLDDTATASEWLGILTGRIRGIKKALKEILKMDGYDLFNLTQHPYYSPYSAEELQLAYASYDILYGTMPDFVPWLLDTVPKRPSSK